MVRLRHGAGMGTMWMALGATLLAGPAGGLSAQQTDSLATQQADSLPSWISSIQIQGTLDTEFSWTRRPVTPLVPTAGTDHALEHLTAQVYEEIS
jgi:hypothetical protein